LMIAKSKYKSVVYICNNKTKRKQKKKCIGILFHFLLSAFLFFFFASTKDRDSSVPMKKNWCKAKLQRNYATQKPTNRPPKTYIIN
jgi:hypothetical protein